MITIEQINDERRGYFKATEGTIEAGRMTYVWAGSQKIIIDHTEVSPDFGGKGVGRLLLNEAVAFARKTQIKILPLCPYAKSVFDKDSEIADVLF